jgi:RNA polymerase primary sigma factor
VRSVLGAATRVPDPCAASRAGRQSLSIEIDTPGGSSLSFEHTRDLVVATEAGDDEARRRLVRAFLPAITQVAQRYYVIPGVERTELIDEGVVGLLRAAQRYDPRFDTPFWAYASWWVRQAMQKLVAEVTRPVVLSDRALRSLAVVRTARRDHVRDHGRDPTRNELAAMTGFTFAQLDMLLAVELTPRGLEEPLSADDAMTATFAQTIADPRAEREYERVLDGIEMQEVRHLAATLDERERSVLSRHYGLGQSPQTLQKIGESLGVSAERVRQIEAGALKKLRDAAAQPRSDSGTMT